MNDQAPPVHAGETYDVEIQSVGEKGDGVARVRGFVLFVPGVKKGDCVKVKVTKVLPKVGFAQVVGQAERPPPQEKKFAEVRREEFQEEMPEQHYEDTDDFG